MPGPDRIVAAIDRLDPESRALVELSYRRGFSDEEIGGLLGVDATEVYERREDAIADIADDIEATDDHVRGGLESLEPGDWDGAADAAPAAEPEPEPTVEEPAEPTPERLRPGGTTTTTPADGSGRGRRALLALAGVAVLVLALVVLLSAGGDDGKTSSSKTGSADSGKREGTDKLASTQPKSADAPPAGGPARPMERLNGTYGRGTARIVTGEDGGATLRLKASGFLEPTGGGYAVWLINPPDDARRLYATADTTIARDIPLPDGYEKYKFVEIARAVPDLDSPHSSFSLLRSRVSALTGG